MCHRQVRRETRPSFVGVASSIPFCSSIPATSRGHGAGSVGVFHRYATATEFATFVRPTRTLPLTALATRWLANGSGSMGSLRARAWPCRSQSGGCAEGCERRACSSSPPGRAEARPSATTAIMRAVARHGGPRTPRREGQRERAHPGQPSSILYRMRSSHRWASGSFAALKSISMRTGRIAEVARWRRGTTLGPPTPSNCLAPRHRYPPRRPCDTTREPIP